MPTINKPKKKNIKKNKAKLIYNTIYNSKTWRKMREAYLMEHPVCEKCGKAFAKEIHHIIPISKADTELEMQNLGFNYSNLQALCEKCHHEVHKNLNR